MGESNGQDPMEQRLERALDEVEEKRASQAVALEEARRQAEAAEAEKSCAQLAFVEDHASDLRQEFREWQMHTPLLTNAMRSLAELKDRAAPNIMSDHVTEDCKPRQVVWHDQVELYPGPHHDRGAPPAEGRKRLLVRAHNNATEVATILRHMRRREDPSSSLFRRCGLDDETGNSSEQMRAMKALE